MSTHVQTPPKILITGASGMLGRALHRVLLKENKYLVMGIGFSRLSVQPPPSPIRPLYRIELQKVNLLNHEETSAFLQQYQPDVIFHCAAERYPDAFEKNMVASFQLNVDSTKHLANEVLRLGDDYEKSSRKRPYLIYISTSYVFDGGISSLVYPPYKTESKTNPINNYGKSKWEGECAIYEVLNKDKDKGQGIIVRVPLLYGEDCSDLSESPALEMMKVHLNDSTTGPKEIDGWALRFPTSTEDVAKVLKLMLEELLKENSNMHMRTYHVASPYGCTKYDLLSLQSKLMNISQTVMEKRAIKSSGSNSSAAPRPKCTQLDCSGTWDAIGQKFEFISLEDGMARALQGFPKRFK